MILDDFRIDSNNGITSFLCTVNWEDQQQNSRDIFFAIADEDAWRVAMNPDAFRIPCSVAARHDGEARITGGGPMCPVLYNGLSSSLAWLARWSKSDAKPPSIDLPIACNHPSPEDKGASALFLSGGIDSSAVLAYNRKAYGYGHPFRISVGIVVIGIQPDRWNSANLRRQVAAARSDLSPIGSAMGIDIIPIVTNVRDLNNRVPFWMYEFQGAALAGLGHLFCPTISNLSIASTWEIAYLDEWGSHPLLDSGYGNHSLRIWHDLAHLGRLEKTRLVAAHPSLLNALNVCNAAEAGDSNCGRCEKCLRTMLTLEALGLLESASAFSQTKIEADDLREIRILDRGLEGEYFELIRPLRRAGRTDLATAIRRKIRRGRFLRQKLVRRTWVSASRVKKGAIRLTRHATARR